MKHKAARLLFLINTVIPALCQEPRATIRVEVVAADTPVSDAAVTVNAVALRSDMEGLAVANVSLGEVRVSVTKDGYFPAKASITADAAREFVVRVEMQPQEEVKEEIKVYATRNDVRIQDSPLHVEVLQREEIEEKMMMTPGDIVMMLNEMGGMRVQTTSPSLGAASVRVQGMLGRYTSFLADGLPLFGQQGAGLGLLQIPPIDLGQVEVIKGNASALYGSAAMAGVVNLISRRPTAEPIQEFLVNRSTLGATDASAFLASRLSSTWSAAVLGSGNWQEKRDVSGDGWTDLAGYSRGVIRPRFYWDNKAGSTALLTGGLTYEDRSGGTTDGGTQPATGAPYTEALRTRRYDVGGSFQSLIGGMVVAARFSHSDGNARSLSLVVTPTTEQSSSPRQRELAASQLGISPNRLRVVSAIAKESPAVIEQLVAGTMTIKQAQDEIAERTRQRLRKAAKKIDPSESQIHVGDLSLLNGLIKDGSADLFLTEPPKEMDAIPLYGKLARLAQRKLKPGGLCAVLCGQLFFDQVFKEMTKHLDYYWIAAIVGDGKARSARVFNRRMLNALRLVVIFAKKPLKQMARSALPFMTDAIPGEQGQHQLQYLVEHLSKPGQLVVIPFVGGGGTVPIACLSSGRRFIGTEFDPGVVAAACARIEEFKKTQAKDH